MRDLFIVGAGGFGREAIWTVERINASEAEPKWNIIGYADDDPKWEKGDNFEGYPILGNVEEVSRDYPGSSVFIAIGSNAKRSDIYKRLRGHDFPAIIDPSAQVSPTTEFKHGTYIATGAIVQVGAEVGKFTLIGARAFVGHDSKVGDFINIGTGTAIAAGVTVCNGVSFFANCSTMPCVTIGENAWITCGAGVKGDVAAGAKL